MVLAHKVKSKRRNSVNTRGPRVFKCLDNDNSYIDISSFRPKKNYGKMISLFTGAGGMEIGLERVGFKTAICVEIDEDCRETLRINRPNWRIFEDDCDRIPGDIRSISPEELFVEAKLAPGNISLISGGAPCQPFSNMGNKRGARDSSNGDLFIEFVKVVRSSRPLGFLFENVAGITQNRHAEVIDYMRHQFDGLGYGISFDILNAADYGVPQQRKRFIMIGLLGKKPSFPLPTHCRDKAQWEKFTTSLNGTPNRNPSDWITVREAFNGLSPKLLQRRDCLGMKHSDEMKHRMSLIKQGQNFKSLPMGMRPNCWKSGKHQGQDTFGRIEENKPSPTIRTAGYNPTKGKYIHPNENRGLNTMEMATLQTFPNDWKFSTKSGKPSIVSIGKQIGNAVPPLFSEALGKAIALQLANL